jgi:hypothetical protein
MVQTFVYIRTPSSYENKDHDSIGIFEIKQVLFVLCYDIFEEINSTSVMYSSTVDIIF